MSVNHKSKAYSQVRYLYNQLTGQNLELSEIVEKQYNYEFTAGSENQKVKILVYFGKKGVSTIIQGDRNSKNYNTVNSIVFGEGLFDAFEDVLQEPEEYIGSDESGKGDFFGPLVIAAVSVDRSSSEKLKRAGVKDSKLLGDDQIRKIAESIRKIIPENQRKIVSINPERYNTLYASFGNLNGLLAWGHSKAIENILLNHRSERIISDKFGDERWLISELAKKSIHVELIQTPKAERYTAVAAASILARDRLIGWFNSAGIHLKMNIPKGAADVVNITAKKIADVHGDEILPKLVKLHFKNYVNNFRNKKGL